ncbi:poly(3-hydroxybutyrate) depolymerase [Moraxella lincolnii]|uniref:portal protein n=1 Tax=Lwoffella lincolnii TaxID=90241 RepID=UPI0039842220
MSLNLNQLSDDAIKSLDISKLQETDKKTKLTKWKKEPSLQDLKRDLENTKTSHDEFIGNLDRWVKLYDAPKHGSAKTKGSRVTPKLIRKQAEWRASALSEPFLSTSNLYDVRALTWEDTKRAKQNALILNMQFNTQLNKVTLVDRIIRSVVKEGTVITRLGWEYQEEEVVETQKQYQYMPVPMEMAEQIQQQYEQYMQLKEKSPDSYEQDVPEEMKAGMEMSEQQGQLLLAQEMGEEEITVIKPVVNKPTVEVCNLRNVFIDPTCQGDLDKAQFVIHSYESSLSDLKSKGFYENLDYLEDYEETGNFDHDSKNTSFKFNDKARKKLVVYEYWGYWDIDGSGITKAIVASWVGNTLIRMEENPFPDKKPPFVVFNYIPEVDSVYGIPDAELLEDNQAILGAITRGVIDLLGKSANSQTGYMKGLLDPTNKRLYRNGEDYEFNPIANPAHAVFTHKYPEVPNSAMNLISMMNGEAESLSGVKAFAGSGITASHLGDVAVGIRGVLDAVSKREMTVLRRLSNGFINMGRKIISMNSEFLNEEEVVRVTNEQFIKVRRDDLLGNFDLHLTISTAEADDAKAKELSFMLQTIGNTMGQEVTQMMLAEIARLRKMPELAHGIESYRPEPDPIQQQLQELEIEYKKAQIELMHSQAQENLARSQVQSAKVNTEHARAESLQGDADNKSLDFIQKDTGIKHDRDLDKQVMINQGQNEKEMIKQQGLLDSQFNQFGLQTLSQ